jgi:hypothetical protein
MRDLTPPLVSGEQEKSDVPLVFCAFRRTGRFWPALLVGLISCSMPYMERAAVTPGLSGGMSAQLTGGYAPNLWGDPSPTILQASGTANIGWGYSERFAQALTVFGGREFAYEGPWREGESSTWSGCWLAGTVLGNKVKVGPRNALKLNLGVMYARESRVLSNYYILSSGFVPVAALSFLHDLNEGLTFGAHLGFPAALGVGLTYHLPVDERSELHAGASNSLIYSGSAAVGVEFGAFEQRSEPSEGDE